MASKNDLASKLAERESKRKTSGVVSALVETPIITQQSTEIEETKMTHPDKAKSIGISIVKKETKSRRKQVLFQPSVHDRAEQKCKEIGISMNEVINQLLEQWINE